MDEEPLRSIRQHLQNKDAQTRILKNIERGRSEATVTIGRAASLFSFTENQLRDWEAHGLISPTKSAGGQRLYPLTELDRLAIIRELIDDKFSPGDIPEDIDIIWNTISSADGSLLSAQMGMAEQYQIDKRVDQTERDNSWRYFISQVMRLALLLMCEDMPDTIVGMIVPLRKLEINEITSPFELSRAGTSLVGWLSRNRAFYSFLSPAPSFEFLSDFRVEQFRVPGVEPSPVTPLIIVQRRARRLFLTPQLVQSVQRLLAIVHHHIDNWRPCFDFGMRDYVYQVADFSTEEHVVDRTLNDLMDRVVELGGKKPDGGERWSFSVLLLPMELDELLPIQQRNLMVRVFSKRTPARLGTFVVSGNHPGLSFRAYQSGRVIYRPHLPPNDYLLPNRETEEETRSAVAIPIAGENGMAVAVLYVASDEPEAFSDADQRALRIMSRMIEELLSTYQSRQQVVSKFSDLLDNPGLVDPAFREFLSEDDFINNLEGYLKTIQPRNDIEPKSRPGSDSWLTEKEAISFIGVDIDNQGSLATKYGDLVARNLSREVGLRIRRQLGIHSNPEYRKLYHISADNYYMMLPGMSLDEARNLAWTLLNLLRGVYRIEARRVAVGKSLKRDEMLELPNVTVRIAVHSYTLAKLKEILNKPDNTIESSRSLIIQNTEIGLKTGQLEGGDVIFSWDHARWDYVLWTPSGLQPILRTT